MIWTNDAGEEHIFTFAELARLSIKAANALRALGVQKGEPVLLMLKRRYEYWLCALGLMRIGAIQIPATHQLQEKDITYRVNAADARTLICVGEEELLSMCAPRRKSARICASPPRWAARTRALRTLTTCLPKRRTPWTAATTPRRRT